MRKSFGKVTFSCIGLGGRASVYLKVLQEEYSDKFKLVAIADIDEAKRKVFQANYDVPVSNVFNSDEEFLQCPRMSDVVIVGTQDRLHYNETIQLLKLGYDIILEKPISTDLEEVLQIYREAKKHPDQMVAVCHVLRHTVFFNTLKEIIDSKKLGRVVNIVHNENVGYYHFAHSYVRGSWNNSTTSSPVIIAKSCHDMDIILYLLGNTNTRRVASYGSLSVFNSSNFDKAEMNERCVNCKQSKTCPYSAVKIYSSDKIKSVVFDKASIEKVEQQLLVSPYGRCVYACDNDVCDHQSTILEFNNGVTATFNLSAFTAKVNRSIKIMCEFGEIRGIEKPYTIEYTDFANDVTTQVPLNIKEGGHGGGDRGFVCHFMDSYLNGEQFTSTLDKSIESHVMAFLAEKSRKEGGNSQYIQPIMEKM